MHVSKRSFWAALLSSILLSFGQSGLAQIPKDYAWQMLSSGIHDKNTHTRAVAIRSLGLVPGNNAVEKLATKALTDPDAEVRIAAASSLGKMKARKSIPALKNALKDDNVGVILAAASSLRSFGDPSAYQVYYAVLTGELKSGEGLVAAQKKLLSDPKKMARLGFEQGIGFIPFAGIGFGVVKALTPNDESPVRAAAAVALASDPDPKSGEALVHAVQDKSWLVRAAALDAIARRDDPTLIPDIVEAIKDEKTEVKFTAAAAVYHLATLRTAKHN